MPNLIDVASRPVLAGCPNRPWRAAAGFFGAGLLALLLASPATAQPNAAAAANARLEAQIAALDARVTRLSAALEAAAQRPAAPQPPPSPAPRREQVALAALNLQSVMATSRPYLRELEALRDAARPALPASLGDPLISHAARGLATPAELRDAFLELAPALVTRAAPETDWIGWCARLLRRLLAPLGLAEPPPPGATETTIANVSRLLARGLVAPALTDVETLDAALQPLVTGWIAQARARVAAEQAVQEIILGELRRPEGR